MSTTVLAEYLKRKAIIAVGTSSAKIAMHLSLTRDLPPQSGAATKESGMYLRLLDFGPDLHEITPLFCPDDEPVWLPSWRELPRGASRVPAVASLLFEGDRKTLESAVNWPLEHGDNIFLINLTGGTGGGVSPEIVSLAPRATKQWGIVNTTQEGDARQITNFCYNFPRVNLGSDWEWKTQQHAWEPKAEPSNYPCYGLLVLFDAASIREKLELNLIPYYGMLLRERVRSLVSPGIPADFIKNIEEYHLLSNEFICRFIEMVALAKQDLPNTLNALAASGMNSVASFVVPCFWPLDDDYEEDLDSYTIAHYIMRAVRVGAMCPGVNPREATAAIVLLQGPRRIIDDVGVQTKAKEQLQYLLGLRPEVIWVLPIFANAETKVEEGLGEGEWKGVRVCVLLMTPSFDAIRSLYKDREQTRSILIAGTNVWKNELRGNASKALRELLDREADPETIRLKFTGWYEQVKRLADTSKYNMRFPQNDEVKAWGQDPSDEWTQGVKNEIQNIKNQKPQRGRSAQQAGEGRTLPLGRIEQDRRG